MLIAVPGAINQRCKPEDAPHTFGQTCRIPISCIRDGPCREENLPDDSAARPCCSVLQYSQGHPRASFPARYPLLALDRMMTCTQGELLDIATHDSPLARRASDHLPITARLRLAAQNGPAQP